MPETAAIRLKVVLVGIAVVSMGTVSVLMGSSCRWVNSSAR